MKREHAANMHEAVESEGKLTPEEEFVLNLVFLRDDWEKGPGSREYSKTDGHAQWYLALSLQFSIAEEEGILPETAKKDVGKFMDWYTNDYGKRSEYPIVDNHEEIFKTSILIQNVITAFKPSYDFDQLPLKEGIKAHLSVSKTWFSGVPDRIVHSTDGPWKIRAGWFLSVAAELWLLLDQNFLTGEAKGLAKDYLNWWVTKANIYFTKEDIERGDKVIDKVLADLGTK